MSEEKSQQNEGIENGDTTSSKIESAAVEASQISPNNAITSTQPFATLEASQSISITNTFHQNVNQIIIQIPQDRLNLYARDYVETLLARNGWLLPVTVIIPLLLTLTTADFHDFLGIDKGTWHGTFIAFTLVCIIWILRVLSKMPSKQTVDDFLKRCKKEEIGRN